MTVIPNKVYTIFIMWKIFEHKKLDGNFYKIPLEIIKRYEKWKDIVKLSGPAGLKLITGFHDEALKGKWHGWRSSRLGKKWRVIYKIEKNCFKVFVIDINPHNYRR